MNQASATPTVSIENIGTFPDQRVRLRGWLYQKRSSGKLHFLQLRDGTGIIQCVAGHGDVSDALFEELAALGQESSLEVHGIVRADPRARSGFELHLSDARILQNAEDYPITPKEHGVAFLLDHRHLWLRSRRPYAILRIRAEVERTCHAFLESRGFLRLDAPVLTPAACEGTTTLFETEYFGGRAYLTQNGQLYSEAGCQAFGRVYCFGPTFRAEKSKTRRHLTEFWMVEPEAAFLDLDGNIELAEALICAIVEQVLEHRRDELEILERDPAPLEGVRAPFPRISYGQALALLEREGQPVKPGDDLGGDEETVLAGLFDRPVVVHGYPSRLKPFYMKRDPENPSLALNMDILAPEGYGEIVGGSVREENLDALDAQMAEQGIDPGPLEWYRDLRRFGAVPHAGFGLGLERTVTWISGVHHLREAIPFPRLMGRLYP